MLLMLERGNVDGIVFFLVLSSVLSKNYLSGFILGLAISLKIFPILILPFYFFFNKLNKKFFIGFAITIPLIIWGFLQLDIILALTRADLFYMCFGIHSVSSLLFGIAKEIDFLQINQYYLIVYIDLILIIFFIILSIIFNFFFKDDLLKILENLKKNKKNLMLFILFSTLIILIFFVFSSFAYRIIFLLPSALICLKNLENFSSKKKLFYLTLATSPFLAPWIITSLNTELLNHYIWIFYSPIVYLSMVFYFVISVNFYYQQIYKLIKK